MYFSNPTTRDHNPSETRSDTDAQLRVKRLEARSEYEAFRVGLLLPGTGDGLKPGTPIEVIELAQFAASPPPAGGALLEFVVTDDKKLTFLC